MYDIYVACFCAIDNLTSQWRRYSNKGGGYSLGFQFYSTTNFTYDIDNIPNLKLAGLRKVVYDFKLQNELIDFALNKLIETAKLIINQPSRIEYGSDPTIFSQISMNFANRLAETIICMKSHVYEKEQEWRLIIFKGVPHLKTFQRKLISGRKTENLFHIFQQKFIIMTMGNPFR